MKMTTTYLLIILAPIIAIWIGVFLKVNELQPGIYMDEIFHVPQAQVFCQADNITWDPKITTLPGLYLISVGILVPISKVLPVGLCSMIQLRSISFVFNLFNVYLIFKILKKIHKTEDDLLKLTALAVGSLPVLSFTSLLYYTDSVAVFCILLMYLFHLYGNDNIAGIIGFISVIVRQTNIIWVFLVAMETAIQQCEWSCKQQSSQTFKSFFNFLRAFSRVVVKPHLVIPLISNIIQSMFFYILTGISFIAFIVINDGIVVGDKSAHEATFNAPQIGYFLSFFFISVAPHLLSFHKFKLFLFSIRNNLFVYIFLGSTCFIFIQNYTYVHPYILADNRHVTFYVWQWFYVKYTYARYAYIPVYLYSAYTIHNLFQHTKFSTKFLFLVCIALATVPQKLLEFRYFIIPYLLLRVQLRSWCRWKILAELLLSLTLNSAVVYFFLYKTFKWPNSSDIQRFMW